MSIVEKIAPKDFPVVETHDRKLSVEGAAVRGLAHGEAIRFPCRWNHYVNRQRRGSHCGGLVLTYSAARRMGFKVKAICKDKMVYVMRHEEHGEITE